MENKMTIKEVLETTVEILSEIQIPVTMTHQIGIPIYASIGNLTQCIKAFEAEQDQEEKDA